MKMNVQVLQGINNENQVTTIKMTLDAEPKTTLLDLIKSFHPIFISDYKIEGNTVSIQSKLPHLWKEAATALNNQATGEWSEDQAKEYLLNKVIKEQVNSMSTIPILHAAMELGYEVSQMFVSEGIMLNSSGASNTWNRRYAVGIGQELEQIASSSSSGDSAIAKKVQQDKWSTNTLITRMGLPIARWQLIETVEDLEKEFERFPKPFVIKPVGLTGGHGVTTNITTLEQARNAFQLIENYPKKMRESQLKIMMQQQVSGEDYRLLVIAGKLKIATKRIPAFVVGDGEHTIAQLIEEINKDPRRNLSDPTHTLKPIIIDDMMHTYLSEQGITVESVPEKDQKIYIRKVASMSQGGVTEDFTEKVHPQIRYIVESIAQTIKAHVLGVDVICLDIGKPLTIENGSFIEMNTMPEAYLNSFPVYGRQYPEIGKWIIEGLMKDKEQTKKVVIIGKQFNEINDILKSNGIDLENETVGIYSEGSIYINGELINTGLETWKAVEAIKLNGSLSVIVLHYPDPKEVEEYGTGFDKIDLKLE